jgi:predicted component of type VI protein secretion system
LSKLTLQFKGRTLKTFPVIEGEMMIGNARNCTVFIDSLAIDEYHAKISTNAQQSTIIDCESEAGTYVNQEKVGNYHLQDGDLIRVGKHTLLYNYQELTETELMHESSANLPAIDTDSMTQEFELPTEHSIDDQNLNPETESGSHSNQTLSAWVQILSGQNLGQTLQLTRAVTNLGKPGVAMVVIARRDNGFFISNLEGKVPPKVGDVEIGADSLKLKEGDLIQIGNIKMQFYLE